MSSLTRRALLRASSAVSALGITGTLTPTSAVAQDVAATPAGPDWVRVYLVVVDGLRPDEVAQMPTLTRLATEGWYYPQARAQMIAETTPNHVSMITGMRVDRHGMPGNAVSYLEDNVGLQARYLQTDTIYSLIARQAPDLVATAATSKEYIVAMTKHMRVDPGHEDADATNDPFFVPVSEAAIDAEVGPDALEQSQTLDPDFGWMSLGDVDRVGHTDETGATGGPPAARSLALQTADRQVANLVDELESSGRWANTVMLVTADHGMDWSRPDAVVNLSEQFAADPDLAEQTGAAENGGSGIYWLLAPEAAGAAGRLRRMREIALATDGVLEAWYTRPNTEDGGEQRWVGVTRPDWGLTGDRTGDLVVVAQQGYRITEPARQSNPVPGNHGHLATLPIPTIVAGGWEGLRANEEAPASATPAPPSPALAQVPADVAPDVRLEEQAENIDMAPTIAYLLGINPPPGGFDGRVLGEAFSRRPDPRIPVADVPSVPRYSDAAGASRFDTAAALSQMAFPVATDAEGTPVVSALVVASGEGFADALAAAPLAAAVGGPLLLTGMQSLPAATVAELRRLMPETVYLVGGPAAISEGVAESIAAVGVADVVRVAGDSRFGTAAQVARTIRARDAQGVPPGTLPPPRDVILVSGETFPDALAAGPLAALSGRLLLLTRAGSLPQETSEVLAEIAPARVLVIGGEAVVGPAVQAALGASVTVERLAGPTRFDTAAAVVERTIREGGLTDRAFLVNGTSFPDALAAGPVIAQLGGMLLPLSPDGLRSSGGIAEVLLRRADGLVEVTWVGGDAALGGALREAVEARILLTRTRRS